MLLLSGDISLNPGPRNNLQPSHLNASYVFILKGFHLVDLDINRSLPKNDELPYIVNSSNVTVKENSKSKLDESVLQSEIEIRNYNVLHRNGNRNGRRVGCYIKSDRSYIY